MSTKQAERPLESDWAAKSIERVQRFKRVRAMTLAERRSILILVDLLLVNGALILATALWVDFEPAPFNLLANAKWFVMLTLVWLIVGSALDIYNPVRAASATNSLASSGVAALVASVVYLLIPWFTPPLSRRIFFAFFVVFVVLGVVLWRVIYARFFFQPGFQRRALIVGRGATAQWVVDELQAAARSERPNPFRGTGYQIAGQVDRLPVGADQTLDPALSLMRFVRTSNVDEILVAEGADLTPDLQEALLDCQEIGVPVVPLSLAYERLTSRLPVAYAVRDLGLIANADDSAGRRLFHVAKRIIDLGLALVSLLGMVLLVPFIALGNALTSPGPLFYRQQRVGRGGEPFVLIKFRTMVPEAEAENGAVWAAEGDPRTTPVGRWLRRTHLDELPQVINVLRGEMSVVGPRPERPQFVGQISGALPIFRARHSVRPGITGWAQIHVRYGNSVDDARLKLAYDLYYVKHASFLLDTVTLLRTFPAMIKLEGN
ncbi:MAG: sugar transferase [Anaerolineae bacterium]|jgi:exopolysaccharide biosynthesis polyprenyl glycosylphosphotransferase